MAKTTKEKFVCFDCGKEYVETNFYKSNSVFYKSIGKVPYCKQDIEKLYLHYYDKYVNEGCLTPERNAVKRLCMAFDIYYRDDVFDSAVNNSKKRQINITPISAYMKIIQLSQYKGKSYDTTVYEDEQRDFVENTSIVSSEETNVDNTVKDFFGHGFSDEDYIYLKKEYDDWTARHECNTKAQEEVFKDICFNRLQNLKALRRGEDTKDITASFQKMLDAGKLQPKQNKGDTTSETQTFGTLIDKWENTRPLPEIDDELKDVDKIGLYIDVFFRSHLAKMAGVKNGISNLYSKFMKKYTVEKPEYKEEENSEEIAFDTIFGNQSLDDDDEVVM